MSTSNSTLAVVNVFVTTQRALQQESTNFLMNKDRKVLPFFMFNSDQELVGIRFGSTVYSPTPQVVDVPANGTEPAKKGYGFVAVTEKVSAKWSVQLPRTGLLESCDDILKKFNKFVSLKAEGGFTCGFEEGAVVIGTDGVYKLAEGGKTVSCGIGIVYNEIPVFQKDIVVTPQGMIAFRVLNKGLDIKSYTIKDGDTMLFARKGDPLFETDQNGCPMLRPDGSYKTNVSVQNKKTGTRFEWQNASDKGASFGKFKVEDALKLAGFVEGNISKSMLWIHPQSNMNLSKITGVAENDKGIVAKDSKGEKILTMSFKGREVVVLPGEDEKTGLEKSGVQVMERQDFTSLTEYVAALPNLYASSVMNKRAFAAIEGYVKLRFGIDVVAGSIKTATNTEAEKANEKAKEDFNAEKFVEDNGFDMLGVTEIEKNTRFIALTKEQKDAVLSAHAAL